MPKFKLQDLVVTKGHWLREIDDPNWGDIGQIKGVCARGNEELYRVRFATSDNEKIFHESLLEKWTPKAGDRVALTKPIVFGPHTIPVGTVGTIRDTIGTGRFARVKFDGFNRVRPVWLWKTRPVETLGTAGAPAELTKKVSAPYGEGSEMISIAEAESRLRNQQRTIQEQMKSIKEKLQEIDQLKAEVQILKDHKGSIAEPVNQGVSIELQFSDGVRKTIIVDPQARTRILVR